APGAGRRYPRRAARRRCRRNLRPRLHRRRQDRLRRLLRTVPAPGAVRWADRGRQCAVERPGAGCCRRRRRYPRDPGVQLRTAWRRPHRPEPGAHRRWPDPGAQALSRAMHWWYLAGAILAEVLATSALKAAAGFTRPLPSLVVVLGY